VTINQRLELSKYPVIPSNASPSDAVAVIIKLGSRFLIQERDAKVGIFYPGHWGFFGGAIDNGETALAAAQRELEEEINLKLNLTYFGKLEYSLQATDHRRESCDTARFYFTASISKTQATEIRLGEGKSYGFFATEEIFELRMTPYDRFMFDWYTFNQK